MASPAARTLTRAIGAYQHAFAHRPSPCRYTPSCSEYAREAVEVHGAGKGGWLTVRRLTRCHPLGGHGFDPVPFSTRPVPTHPGSEHGAH